MEHECVHKRHAAKRLKLDGICEKGNAICVKEINLLFGWIIAQTSKVDLIFIIFMFYFLVLYISMFYIINLFQEETTVVLKFLELSNHYKDCLYYYLMRSLSQLPWFNCIEVSFYLSTAR